MKERRRGEDTKERILEEACKVFAEMGYRDATHAEICRRANANAAAVNYYFSSKDKLYRAAFKHLDQKAERLYPLDGGLPDSAPARERLRAFVRAHLGRVFDPEHLGDQHRIRMKEMFDSTGLLDEVLARKLAHHRGIAHAILRDLLGPDATQHEVEWCEMSVVAQCFIAAPVPDGRGPRGIFGLSAKDLDQLTEHIVGFSLAGIEAIRKTVATKKKTGRTRSAKS